MMVHHEILFYRNPISGQFRAVCNCGWTLDDKNALWVQERAAVHDLVSLPFKSSNANGEQQNGL